MQGILLTKDNRDKIRQSGVDLSTQELDEMIAEYEESGMVFIPVLESGSSKYDSWASVPLTTFQAFFETSDMEKMKTELVDITHKSDK